MFGDLPRLPSLATLTDEERQRLHALATVCAQRVDAFCEAHTFSPLVRRRIWPLTAMMTSCYRELDAERLSLVTKLVLWIFALDDAMDAPEADYGALARFLGRSELVVHGAPTVAADHPLLPALCELRGQLACLAPWEELGHTWACSVVSMHRGMLFECYWRVGYRTLGHDALPTYQQYMVWARHSVGVPPMLNAVLLALDDPTVSTSHRALARAIQVASESIRLANDIQTAAKEIEEGNVNSLVILGRAAPDDDADLRSRLDWARQEVGARLRAALGVLHASTSAPTTKTGAAEMLIRRTGVILSEFYADHDYHTYIGDDATVGLARH